MRCLARNKQVFYHAPFVRTEEMRDASGFLTGEHHAVYGAPIRAHGNISPAAGQTSTQQFGENIQYDKAIVLDDPAFPLDEFSVLWVDVMPAIDAENVVPHDYIVKKIAQSLNSVSIAIKRVDVSG